MFIAEVLRRVGEPGGQESSMAREITRKTPEDFLRQMSGRGSLGQERTAQDFSRVCIRRKKILPDAG